MKKANRDERNRLNDHLNGAIALPGDNRPEKVASTGQVIDPMADPSLQAALALFMSTWGEVPSSNPNETLPKKVELLNDLIDQKKQPEPKRDKSALEALVERLHQNMALSTEEIQALTLFLDDSHIHKQSFFPQVDKDKWQLAREFLKLMLWAFIASKQRESTNYIDHQAKTKFIQSLCHFLAKTIQQLSETIQSEACQQFGENQIVLTLAQFYQVFSDQQISTVDQVLVKKLEPVDKVISELLKDALVKKEGKKQLQESKDQLMSEALLKMKSELVQNKFEDTDDLDAVLNYVPQEYIFLTSFLGEQVNKPMPVEEHEEKKLPDSKRIKLDFEKLQELESTSMVEFKQAFAQMVLADLKRLDTEVLKYMFNPFSCNKHLQSLLRAFQSDDQEFSKQVQLKIQHVLTNDLTSLQQTAASKFTSSEDRHHQLQQILVFTKCLETLLASVQTLKHTQQNSDEQIAVVATAIDLLNDAFLSQLIKFEQFDKSAKCFYYFIDIVIKAVQVLRQSNHLYLVAQLTNLLLRSEPKTGQLQSASKQSSPQTSKPIQEKELKERKEKRQKDTEAFRAFVQAKRQAKKGGDEIVVSSQEDSKMDVESDKDKDEEEEPLPTFQTNSFGLILKNCCYTLTMVFRHYMESLELTQGEIGTEHLPEKIILGILEFAKNAPSFADLIVDGILSQLCQAKLKFKPDLLRIILTFFSQEQELKILGKSRVVSVFLIKLVLKSKLNLCNFESLIDYICQLDCQQGINVQGIPLNLYLVVVCLVGQTEASQRVVLINKLMAQLPTQSDNAQKTFSQMQQTAHLLRLLLLLRTKSFTLVKKSVFKFLTGQDSNLILKQLEQAQKDVSSQNITPEELQELSGVVQTMPSLVLEALWKSVMDAKKMKYQGSLFVNVEAVLALVADALTLKERLHVDSSQAKDQSFIDLFLQNACEDHINAKPSDKDKIITDLSISALKNLFQGKLTFNELKFFDAVLLLKQEKVPINFAEGQSQLQPLYEMVLDQTKFMTLMMEKEAATKLGESQLAKIIYQHAFVLLDRIQSISEFDPQELIILQSLFSLKTLKYKAKSPIQTEPIQSIFTILELAAIEPESERIRKCLATLLAQQTVSKGWIAREPLQEFLITLITESDNDTQFQKLCRVMSYAFNEHFIWAKDETKKAGEEEVKKSMLNPVSQLILQAICASETLAGSEVIARAFIQLDDKLALYLCSAFKQPKASILLQQVQTLFQKLIQADLIEELTSQLLEFIYDSLGTACGIFFSVNNVLEDGFLMNCLEMAGQIANCSQKSQSSQRFLQFLKDSILQLALESQETKNMILDIMCSFGQQIESEESNPTLTSLIQSKRDQLSKAKKDKLCQRDQQLKLQEEEFNKFTGLKQEEQKTESKKKNKLLGGFGEKDYDVRNTQYKKYMHTPEDVCTRAKTGSVHAHQHWYHCITCGMVGNIGCCAVCVRTCHQGHNVYYEKFSGFFCDCQDNCACKHADVNKPPVQPKEASNPFSQFGQPPNASGFIRPQDGFGFEREAQRFGQRGRGGFNLFGRDEFDQRQLSEQGVLASFHQRIHERQFERDEFLKLAAQHRQSNHRESAGLFGDGGQFGGIKFPGSQLFGAGDANMDSMSEDMHEIGDLRLVEALERESHNEFRKLLLNENKALLKRVAEQEEDQNEESYNSSLSNSNPSDASKIDNIMIDHEMSESASLADSWQLSDNDSTYKQGKFDSSLALVNDQKARFSNLQSILADQQLMVEGILSSVYGQLDSLIQDSSLGKDCEMIDTSSLKLTQKQSSISVPQMPAKPEYQTDMATCKKAWKDSAFKLNLQNQRQVKNFVNSKIHQRQCVTVNDKGLICLLEEEQVNFYASLNLMEETMQEQFDNKSIFKTQAKQPTQVCALVEQFKSQTVPTSCMFNPAYDQFIAIWGSKDLQVLTIGEKDGKIKSELTVNLMLEAFGDQLTITRVLWVPGSKTIIAVGTESFIRVYDLSKDNFSPMYNISTVFGIMVSFTFTPPVYCGDLGDEVHSTRIIVALKTGELFSQELNLAKNDKGMQVDSHQSEISLTQQIEVPERFIETADNPQKSLLPNNKQLRSIESIDYLPTSKFLAVQFSSQHVMFARLDDPTYSTIRNALIIPNLIESDHLNTSAALQLSSNGKFFANFKEVPNMCKPDNIFLAANYYKPAENSQITVLLHLKENALKYQILRPIEQTKQNCNKSVKHSTIQGFCFAKPSVAKRSNDLMRLITFDENGSACVYSYQSAQPSDNRKSSNDEESKHKTIKRTDLPLKVQMPINFFEKMKNLYEDQTIKKLLHASGNIASLIKGNARLFDDSPEGPPSLEDNRETNLKLSLKLKKSDALIVGMRIIVETGKASSKVLFKVMNRTPIILKPKEKNILEIGLSDVEVIFACQSRIDLEFINDDPKNNPLKLYKIKLYSQSIKDFKLKEKIERHCKEIMKQQSEKKFNAVVTNEDMMLSEMMQTNHVPLLTWMEKHKLMSQLGNVKYRNMIMQLDIISQVILSNAGNLSADLQQTLNNLVTKLTQVLANNLQRDTESDKKVSQKQMVLQSVKRLLRVSLQLLMPQSMLGDPLDYRTIKDTIFFQKLEQTYLTEDLNQELSQEEIVDHLERLNYLIEKRYQQVFLKLNDKLVPAMTDAYLRMMGENDKDQLKPQSQIRNEIANLIGLLLVHFQIKVNQSKTMQDGLKASTMNLKQLVQSVMDNEDDLCKQMLPIQKLLLSKNTKVAKAAIKSLQKCLYFYQATIVRSLVQNKVITVPSQNGPIQIVLIDAIPHLLTLLLQHSIPSLREQSAHVLYKVAFLCMQAYVKKAKTSVLPLEFIFRVVKRFMTEQLCDLQINEQTYGYIYTNLTLINMIFLAPDKKKLSINLAASSTLGVGLTNQMKQALQQYLNSEGDFQEKLISWTASALEKFNAAFQAGRCSLRIKFEDSIKAGSIDHLALNDFGDGVKLLRPISQQFKPWQWSPLFADTNDIFELLDRKVPSSLLIFCQVVISDMANKESQQFDKLLRAVSQISQTLPTADLLRSIGSTTLDHLSSEKAKLYENQTLFKEFISEVQAICGNKLMPAQAGQKNAQQTNIVLSYKIQFHLHNLLSKGWQSAQQTPQNWRDVVTRSGKGDILMLLTRLSYALGDQSATLCLALAALAIEPSQTDVQQSIVSSINISSSVFAGRDFNLATTFARKQKGQIQSNNQEEAQQILLAIDYKRLINVFLLGKSDKQLRIAAAHLLKGFYDSNCMSAELLIKACLAKFASLKTSGIFSSEFLSIFAVIFSLELDKGTISKELSTKVCKYVYQSIQMCNQQITAHPNLDLYALTHKLCSSGMQPQIQTFESFGKFGAPPVTIQQQQGSEEQQYILEMEPCSKCWDTKTTPFKTMRLNQVETEAKFTDCSSLYRLSTSQQIKSFSANLKESKGLKAVKQITLYVNNIQEMDLTEMKNNWQVWQKVQSIDIDISTQTSFKMDLPLPITALNIMIEFQTVNLQKPIDNALNKHRKQNVPGFNPPAQESEKVQSVVHFEGLDYVLNRLPQDVAQKLTIAGTTQNRILAGNPSSQNALNSVISTNCPICGRLVNNAHGRCQCGENALQCPSCRNINFEKVDPYQCKECGNSRYSKFEFTLLVKEGSASMQAIESEDQRKNAEKQIENNLQKAQQCYTSLMSKRESIKSQVNLLNEGSVDASASALARSVQIEAVELYNNMMKALSTIKLLKIEINSFQKISGGSSKGMKQSRSMVQFEDDEEEIRFGSESQTCFGCTQKYLQSLLNFVQVTASDSALIRHNFQVLNQAEALYANSLRMYNRQIQTPARSAICALVKDDPELSQQLLTKIESDLKSRKDTIPAHLLQQSLYQESLLLLKLYEQNRVDLKENKTECKYAVSSFWRVLFSSLQDAEHSAAVAQATCSQFLKVLLHNITKDEQDKESHQLLIDYFKASDADKLRIEFVKGDSSTVPSQKFWLMGALLLQSSQEARKTTLSIILKLLQDKTMHTCILETMLEYLDKSLECDPLSSEQFFNLLTKLMTQTVEEEKDQPQVFDLKQAAAMSLPALKKKTSKLVVTADTERQFSQLFSKLDYELVKLIALEQEKASLGNDGFMPLLSAGQSLCRLVEIVSRMMQGQPTLTQIVQENVRVVLKSLLKLKKLNLVKNKQIKNCEDQIQGIFDQLHSERETDKSNFIYECLKLIESGDCDLQESRYLFEDICKMICPVKPEIEYFLQLQKARSNEEFIPGRMSKNPYSSNSFNGKTMGDVRLKICRDCEIGEPEMLELLVANKIVTMGLSIRAVYEQVWWPYIYKQKFPDSYEVPQLQDYIKTDPSMLQNMVVIFRLAGMDGEATEDRIESLPDETEPTSEKEIEKKYSLANVISEKLERVTGVDVLLLTLDAIQHLQGNKDLASWLVQLISIAIKIKKNRIEFLKNPRTVSIIANKMFQSVGMHSKFDGKNEQSLFDVILGILEILISEQMQSSQADVLQKQQKDSTSNNVQMIESSGNGSENQSASIHQESQAAAHVEIFLSLISDSCKEMLDSQLPLDKAPKKIKSVSKVLPQLITENEHDALKMLVDLFNEHLNFQKVDVKLLKQACDQNSQFRAQFYLDRLIDILESIPASNNFIKDAIYKTQSLEQLVQYMQSFNQFNDPTFEVTDKTDKETNIVMLRIFKGLVKNHPSSQQLLSKHGLVQQIYLLSLQNFKDMKVVLLAQEIVQLLTNELADADVRELIQGHIAKRDKERQEKAKKAKALAMAKMQKRNQQNKFSSMLAQVKEELGPKCVSCEDGYTNKQNEILGIYVFSKRQQANEWSGSGSHVSQSHCYTTVTHNNYIHFSCHNEASRVDRDRQQPIKEWDGSKTRNHMTLCNNLFPVMGGKITIDNFMQQIDKFFQVQKKQIGPCDSNRVKVLSQDLKSLLKRFSCNESFSRDSKGGGPEHNMQFVPLLVSMIVACLESSPQNRFTEEGEKQDKFVFLQEKKLAEFLQQGVEQKTQFLSRIEEEEKNALEVEEEEKHSDDDNDGEDMEEEEEDESESQDDVSRPEQIGLQFKQGLGDQIQDDSKLDQIFYFMSQALIFGSHEVWSKIKQSFITIAMCAVASKQTQTKIKSSQDASIQLPSFRITDASEVGEIKGRARSVSDVARMDVAQNQLLRLRPLLLMLSLVDTIKTKWLTERAVPKQGVKVDEYLRQLCSDYLRKDNLKLVQDDSTFFFKTFTEMQKIQSIEGFIVQLGLKQEVMQEFGSVEKFVLSHF